MDGWMDGWMNGWMDRLMDRLMDGWMEEGTDGRMEYYLPTLFSILFVPLTSAGLEK